MAAIQDGERDISHTMFITINAACLNLNDHDCNSCCSLFFSIKKKKVNHNFTLQEVWRSYFQSQEVLKTFFSSRASSSTRQVGFKPRMPLPSLEPADERHQTLFVAGKKDTCATLSKAVNVLAHNSQARDLGVCLCGKALAGHGGTSIISACLPGGACVEITAPINKQSPSVEIFIQTELHPCGGLSEHSSCTLKGYSESHVWASTP